MRNIFLALLLSTSLTYAAYAEESANRDLAAEPSKQTSKSLEDPGHDENNIRPRSKRKKLTREHGSGDSKRTRRQSGEASSKKAPVSSTPLKI